MRPLTLLARQSHAENLVVGTDVHMRGAQRNIARLDARLDEAYLHPVRTVHVHAPARRRPDIPRSINLTSPEY